MTNKEKKRIYQQLIDNPPIHQDGYFNALERCGDVKNHYYDYLITEPINVEEELKRVDTADYELLTALFTMLFREDHFSNGIFQTRVEQGWVKRILERLVELL